MRILAAVLIAVSVAGPIAAAQSSQPEPTYSWLAQNIFQPVCGDCHSPPNPDHHLNLQSYEAIMQSGVVVAGDPDHSKLYQMVATGKMPKKASPLSPDQVQAVYFWIKNGATK